METTVTDVTRDEEDAGDVNVDEEEYFNLDQQNDADWTADLHWLTPQLAVGSCFPMDRAADIAGEHGISAVVDLREEDRDDEERLRAAGIELLHLPTPDLQPATIDMLDEGVAWISDRIAAGGKVLVHCRHGIGRSALLSLCVLSDQGWSPLDALAHMKDKRAAVSPSRSQYEGWAAWLETRGLAAPDYHTFGCIAYRHLANG